MQTEGNPKHKCYSISPSCLLIGHDKLKNIVKMTVKNRKTVELSSILKMPTLSPMPYLKDLYVDLLYNPFW